MSKMLRCLKCGEATTVEELVKNENGDFVCPTCKSENLANISNDDEEDKTDDDVLGIEPPTECTCIHCGDDFIGEDEEDEVCNECQEALDNSEDIKLHIALAEYFGCSVKDIAYNDNNEWNIDGADYMVLDDYEADEKCGYCIRETLWAFNPSFLADETELPYEIFEALSDSGNSEYHNNGILEEVIEKTCGMDSFVESAISSDGRGHFLNDYNGEEDEIIVNNEYYYAYRV